MGVYNRDGRWMVFYHDENGKRRDKSFGRGEDGCLKANDFDQAYRAGKNQSDPSPDPKLEVNTTETTNEKISEIDFGPGIRLGPLSRKYLQHLIASGKTDKHIKILGNLLVNHFVPFFGNKPVDQMTYQEDILPFILHIKGESEHTKKPRSQHTVNRYCDYLDAIFNFGIVNGLSSVNPMKGRKKAKERPFDVQLTIDDMKKIMDNSEPHLKWAIEVCFNLGTRPGESELLSLRWDHIDFDKSTARIYATKTKTFRTVPIHPQFLQRLNDMKEFSTSDYVVEYHGRQVKSLKMSFKNACNRAGIKYRVRMYDLRHLFATTLLTKGADLAAVSKLMGHSTVKMTADTYYHYLEGEKERAVSLLPQIAV